MLRRLRFQITPALTLTRHVQTLRTGIDCHTRITNIQQHIRAVLWAAEYVYGKRIDAAFIASMTHMLVSIKPAHVCDTIHAPLRVGMLIVDVDVTSTMTACR